MKSRTLFSLLIPVWPLQADPPPDLPLIDGPSAATLLLTDPPVTLSTHGWSENTKEGNFSKDGKFTFEEAVMVKPTHRIGVLIPIGDKLVVKDVMEGSPAQKAGIRANDEVVEINGIKLSGIAALRGIISAAGAQELEIMVHRGEGGHVFVITPEPVEEDSGERKGFDEHGFEELEKFALSAEAVDENSADREIAEVILPTEVETGARTETREREIGSKEEKVEELLGQILAEMKKMNSRPQPPIHFVPSPGQLQRTQKSAVPRQRRVVLPPTKKKAAQPNKAPPVRQPESLSAPLQKDTD